MENTKDIQRWWDLPAVLLLLTALLITTLRLTATEWTDELALVQIISFLGAIAGLALGMSKFQRGKVTLFSVVYGLFVIFGELGSILGEGVLWLERIRSLLGRLSHSTQALIQQKAVTDPLLFLMLMATLFWILSVHAGFSLTRTGNPWRATLPPGLALFIIHIHDPLWPSRTWYLAAYIFLSLILIARTSFLHNQADWQSRQTRVPPYVGLDFLRATLVLGVVLILLAWTIPAFAANVPPARQAWFSISRPYYQMRDKMSNAFASLRASVGLVNDYYGETLPLGRGNALNDMVVLSVKAPPKPAEGTRYYWRARVYETFEGGRWTSPEAESENLNPESFDLRFPDGEGRWEGTFTFFPGVPMSVLYTVPQPLWISRPVNANYTSLPNGTVDLTSIRGDPSVQPGETYEVRSSITHVAVERLREAGTEYPDWVKERYLKIPSDTTQRTVNLAQEIASSQNNPYDIADAVTNYLRDNIEYVNSVPVPPAEQEIIDWMLFDLQQGFCNYYATAEIVLLRSLGIPARLAVGYAQGTYDSENSIYSVHQRDAHAWPEVFFPEIGWVEFEPTVNQRPIRRPLSDEITDDSTNSPSNPNESGIEDPRLEEMLEGGLEPFPGELDSSPRLTSQPSFWAFTTLFGFLLIGLVVYIMRKGWSGEGNNIFRTPIAVKIEKQLHQFGFQPPRFLRIWAYRAALPQEARAYEEINRALKRLGEPPRPDQTPTERAAHLSYILPNGRVFIKYLLREYQHLIYRKTDGNPLMARQAAQKIRTLSWIQCVQLFLKSIQDAVRRKFFAS